MKKVNYIVASDGIPYLLTAERLIEGELFHFDQTRMVRPYSSPQKMTRSAVAKAMKGPADFTFKFKDGDGGTNLTNGQRNGVAIRFGCTKFSGKNFRKLKAWAVQP